MECAAESGRRLGGGQALGASSCRAGWVFWRYVRMFMVVNSDWESGGEDQGCGILCNELGNPIE